MNQWKSAHAAKTDKRTLAEAMDGADVFFGVSVKGAVTKEMVASMADNPIIFPMANPDPEILPEEIAEVRSDAIIATGRSDYPNQINNVLGFPYIFRGALDVRASTINMEMKVAAAHALAALAREDVPDEVDKAYSGRRLQYGREYIIPTPFDPRLIVAVPRAVAEAACETGVAGRPPEAMRAYEKQLSARLDPTAAALQTILDRVRENPKRVCFAEGEEERVIRAAIAFEQAGYGKAILIGREHRIRETMKAIGVSHETLEVHNARLSEKNHDYTDYIYARGQRDGLLYRDCQRMVNQDRNVFGACMLAQGDVDALVTGVTRSFNISIQDIFRAVDPKEGHRAFGLSIIVQRNRTVFISDTSVHELPTPEELCDIAIQSAEQARSMGHEPRVAFLSYSNFGQPMKEKAERVREAVALMDARKVDFEYDGEMQASVALDYEMMRDLYPFCRLSGPANVLIMPALHSANISAKLLQKMGGGTVIGPMLIGMGKPAQVVPMGATVSDLVTAASLAAYDAGQ